MKFKREYPSILAALLRGLAALAAAAGLLAATPKPVAAENHCRFGFQEAGGIFEICMPPEGTPWNGDVLLFAHGYVGAHLPVVIPRDHMNLQDGSSIESLVTRAGYAFATTSYRTNGLAVLPAVNDMIDLAEIFREKFPQTRRIYLAGVSEGGLVTAMAVEQRPDLFAGGLAMCGPLGDFRRQIDYWGDFRVLFDIYFPGLIPGDAMRVPQDVIDNFFIEIWPKVESAVRADPQKTIEFLNAANAPYDPARPETMVKTVYDLVWYSVFSTNNGQAVLGGQPFSNEDRIYRGSKNDGLLNLRAARYSADRAALLEMERSYTTSGKLSVPLVTMHHQDDQIVPYFHESIYYQRVLAAGSQAYYTHLAIPRYGHCDFEPGEALAAFSTLVYKASGQLPTGIAGVLESPTAQQEFMNLVSRWAVPALEMALPGLRLQGLLPLP